MITSQQFKQLFPMCKDPDGWVASLNDLLPKYDINTPKRIASFLAQCGHESGGFTVFSENLNYSAKSLNAVFPKYFVKAGRDAAAYAKQPEKIANVIYGGRMGNTVPGDGFKFRGRGPIQMTGKANYTQFGKDMCVDILSNPDLVSTDKKISVLSAIWFWRKNNLNKYADADDIKGMTKIINGGYIGLDDRIAHWSAALTFFGTTAGAVVNNVSKEEDEDTDVDTPTILRRGMKGDAVKEIQTALKINADGVFGPGTETAVKNFQSANGLMSDGVVGPITLEKLLG